MMMKYKKSLCLQAPRFAHETFNLLWDNLIAIVVATRYQLLSAIRVVRVIQNNEENLVLKLINIFVLPIPLIAQVEKGNI